MNVSDLRVLICDDSILVRKKLTDILKLKGITAIFEAGDGVKAVDSYKELRPDVTFMVIVMPEKSGVDALKEIKAFDPDAKVIMASTLGTQNYLLEAIKSGAADFMQKPIKDEEVFKVLNKIAGSGD